MRAYIVREKKVCGGKYIHDPRDAYDIMKTESQLDREVMWLLPMNNKNQIVRGIMPVAYGSTNSTLVDPIGIFRELIMLPTVVGFMIVHNHPSGSLKPSPEDIHFSKLLKDGAKVLGLAMLDSLIISIDGVRSLREGGEVTF